MKAEGMEVLVMPGSGSLPAQSGSSPVSHRGTEGRVHRANDPGEPTKMGREGEERKEGMAV